MHPHAFGVLLALSAEERGEEQRLSVWSDGCQEHVGDPGLKSIPRACRCREVGRGCVAEHVNMPAVRDTDGSWIFLEGSAEKGGEDDRTSGCVQLQQVAVIVARTVEGGVVGTGGDWKARC